MARLRSKLEEIGSESGEPEGELDEEDEATGPATGAAAPQPTGIASESRDLAAAITRVLLPALESRVPAKIKGRPVGAVATA